MSYMSRFPQTIASLPWYDFREVRTATDVLWHELARQFRLAGISNVPKRLNREVAYDRQWTSSGFLFGQACGYDVRIAYADQLQVVATPCYRAAGCTGSNYSSFIVVRDVSPFQSVDHLRDTRCVINTPTSHSGMNVLRALVAPLHSGGRFFKEVRISGSHAQSLRMIKREEVDVAAIDCITYALLSRHRPHELLGTRVIHQTDPVPAPPYVTAASTPPETLVRMQRAVLSAFDQPSLVSAKETLLLCGAEVLADDAYYPIESLESVAHNYSYREIPGHSLASRVR